MSDLQEKLRSKWEWLKATPGIPGASVKLTEDELLDLITALELAKVVVKFPSKD